jgi:hypothetical protein
MTKEVCKMNSRFEKVLRVSLLLALPMLFVTLQGCPLVQGDLAEGSAYDVEIQVLEDGTLYAATIEPSDDGEKGGEQDGENEDGENEEQEGENDADSDGDSDSDEEEDGENDEQEGESDADSDSDSDSDGDSDSDEEEDGENEDGEDEDGENEDVEMGFSVQVDAVSADCSSFTVFRSLIVVLEADDGEQEGEQEGENVEQEGENEGENGLESVTPLSKDVVSEDPPSLVGTTLDQGEDGEEEIGICDLTAGMWIEVEGEYGTDGIFTAEEIEIADEAETEIEAVLENLTEGTFMMLGLVITYDENTVIGADAEAEDEDGENEDGEDDDVGCEQEGENEGENAGC